MTNYGQLNDMCVFQIISGNFACIMIFDFRLKDTCSSVRDKTILFVSAVNFK